VFIHILSEDRELLLLVNKRDEKSSDDLLFALKSEIALLMKINTKDKIHHY